jgi:hypothetical protein
MLPFEEWLETSHVICMGQWTNAAINAHMLCPVEAGFQNYGQPFEGKGYG